jgi:hypothetical protein
MKEQSEVRTHVSATGSFVSIPEAVAVADTGVRHLLKLEFTTNFSEGSSDPLKLETGFSTDRVLIDFRGVVAGNLDAQKIAKDCDLVRDIALRNPDKLRQMLEAQTESVTGFQKAYAIGQEIGLTEEAAVKAGGGLLWLVAIAALAVMAGSCERCHASHEPH